MDLIVLVCTSAAVLVGLVGAFVHRLPGVVLIWAAMLGWASIENTRPAWIVLGVATVIAVANYTIQHLFAGRRPAELVAPVRSVAVAAGFATAGFLAARVLGMLAAFVAALYLAERRRLRLTGPTRTRIQARAAVSRESVTELAAGLLITTAWLAAVGG